MTLYHALSQDTQEAYSPECLVGELLHLLSKELLGSISKDMMEVTTGSTASMAQELIPTHTAEPGWIKNKEIKKLYNF